MVLNVNTFLSLSGVHENGAVFGGTLAVNINRGRDLRVALGYLCRRLLAGCRRRWRLLRRGRRRGCGLGRRWRRRLVNASRRRRLRRRRRSNLIFRLRHKRLSSVIRILVLDSLTIILARILRSPIIVHSRVLTAINRNGLFEHNILRISLQASQLTEVNSRCALTTITNSLIDRSRLNTRNRLSNAIFDLHQRTGEPIGTRLQTLIIDVVLNVNTFLSLSGLNHHRLFVGCTLTININRGRNLALRRLRSRRRRAGRRGLRRARRRRRRRRLVNASRRRRLRRRRNLARRRLH